MRWICCLLAIGLAPSAVWADVRPAPIFSDNLVLQRDMAVPVWGTARPGESVTVSLAGRSAAVTADDAGRWRVSLPPMPAGGPLEMTIAAGNTITVRNVAIGEVWLAGGQSNMDMKLSASEGGAEAAREADDPLFRVFEVATALPLEPAAEARGTWHVCTPQRAGQQSATAHYFARQLRQTLGVPVGILQTGRGWTPAEAWTGRLTLLADPDLRYIVERWDRWTAAYPAAKELYENKLAEWKRLAAEAKAAGRPEPAKPAAPSNPEFIHRASSLYNGMIAPLAPFALRGTIWYQGETNASRADQYRRLFPAMIRDWRARWGQGDFPFLFVQIAPLDTGAGAVDRAELREAQREALAAPRTAMVVTLDIGDLKDEHPKNKREVGRRLALAAERLAYGRDVVFSGPLYRGMAVEGGAVRLRFDHADGGLVTSGGRLAGFTLAGEDRKFVAAEARIDGADVVVSARGVSRPAAVRYAWSNDARASLFNRAGLPASPFRTDDWPLTTSGERRMFFEQIGLDEQTLTPRSK